MSAIERSICAGTCTKTFQPRLYMVIGIDYSIGLYTVLAVAQRLDPHKKFTHP